MRRAMGKRFEIDGLIYEVGFTCANQISFAIVGRANPAYDTYTYAPYDLQIIDGEHLFFKLKPGAACQDSYPSPVNRSTAA